MTGRIHSSPKAEQQLDKLDDWIAEASSPETAQRFISAWFVWVVGAAMTLGARTVLARRRPGTGWQRAALAVAAVMCAPMTAALGAVASLFTSVHGFATVMWTFAALPLAAVLAGTVQSLSSPDRFSPHDTT
ncbi:hypothetical protein GA707_18085 [Nostocoides sp. F2B08]|uniref:hypothetical protein n=1 Tax=Nostocoides sp. F2B08 TaxID=2653936 RepID=UPI001263C7DD|nr:hypothetical protein [Tetrasphaera sp. F2B08]KAB7741453.1 hypothetical protein GA707_18085 [Tetrasphaera sp. F2B08]